MRLCMPSTTKSKPYIKLFNFEGFEKAVYEHFSTIYENCLASKRIWRGILFMVRALHHANNVGQI